MASGWKIGVAVEGRGRADERGDGRIWKREYFCGGSHMSTGRPLFLGAGSEMGSRDLLHSFRHAVNREIPRRFWA